MSLSENSTSGTLLHLLNEEYQPLEDHAHGFGALSVNSYPQSPYTDTNPFYLDVGPSKKRFSVHRMILSQSTELEVKQSGMLWGERTSDSIALPDIDEATAHTLVHYLYSGNYQTLESFEDTLNPFQKTNVSAYKLSTCVYCAAMRYKLPGLAELAKGKITSISERLSIIDILSVAREQAFPNLPKNEVWYPIFIDDAIKTAVAQDSDLFMKPAFVEQIGGDNRFKQVVVSAMLNSYARGPASVSERPTGLSTPMTEARTDDKAEHRSTSSWDERPEHIDSLSEAPDQDMIMPEAQAEVSEMVGEADDGVETPKGSAVVTESESASGESVPPPPAEDELPPPPPPTVDDIVPEEPHAEDELKLDDIEPSQPAHAEPEPFTDELGFANSKTYQNQRQVKKSKDETATAIPEVVPSLHKRSDSVTTAEKEIDILSEPTSEASPAVAEPIVNGEKPAPKKNKKKKKKNPTTFA